MHAAALEHGVAGNGTGPRTPFSQASPQHDEPMWLLYESYLLALDDEALAGLPTPPPSDYWASSPSSIDSYNNWEPPDEDGSHRGWSPYDYLSPGPSPAVASAGQSPSCAHHHTP